MDANQKSRTALVLSDVLLVIALLAALGFGYWAFSERQRYKNDTDEIVKQEVVKAEAAQKDELQKAFAQREKSPYKLFKGPATYGTIAFSYPKTWSGYVDQSSSDQPVNGYFHPGVVPAISQSSSAPIAFALRVELLSTDYAEVVKQFESQITQGELKASAYLPPRMSKVANVQTGTMLEGAISEGLRGSMVVIKVRDKTLQISTQSNNYLNDFNNVILRSLTFVP